MAILRDSQYCLYNSVIRLCFPLFTLELFKTFIEQEKVDGAWRILHVFTPETRVWLLSSPLSHSAAPLVMSAQRMSRRSWFFWQNFALLFYLDSPSGSRGCCVFRFSPAFIYWYRPNNESHYWNSWSHFPLSCLLSLHYVWNYVWLQSQRSVHDSLR